MSNNTIRILSWNIEHFRNNNEKIKNVTKIIKDHNPDIFALYEIEANIIYDIMLEKFPKHSIFMTEGQQSQEILVACRNNYEGIKFQQKDKFKSGNPKLRPGVFLSFRYPGKSLYGFLFLHTDSGTSAVDFGNRNEMFEHAFNLKRKLDHISDDKPTNYMILGDLNTMGLKYPKQIKSDIIAHMDHEIEYIDYESMKKGRYKLKPKMRRLRKPIGTHFSTRYGISDLDHIIVSDHLKFKKQNNIGEAEDFEVLLDGWRRFPDDYSKRKEFADKISDHCLLLCDLKIE
jgi:hypothetical protein